MENLLVIGILVCGTALGVYLMRHWIWNKD